jgi:hypothetical protein
MVDLRRLSLYLLGLSIHIAHLIPLCMGIIKFFQVSHTTVLLISYQIDLFNIQEIFKNNQTISFFAQQSLLIVTIYAMNQCWMVTSLGIVFVAATNILFMIETL